jgi:NAD(P)-dependent dehydrogenase (short-subunit alcohol dehydrogenase family)
MADVTARHVVITGASSGIGRTCALELAARGFKVFAGVRSEADFEPLRREGLVPLRLDVTDASSVAAAAAQVAEVTPGLAGLINNAGIAVTGPLEFLPIEDLRRTLEVNVVGTAVVTQHFLPLLRRGKGRVVNMSSTAGFLALPMLGAYAASKFALEAMSDALRVELKPWGLHVALIEPGNISTPMWGKTEDATAALSTRLPAEANALYATQFAAMRKLATEARDGASPPQVVSRAVEHALTSSFPRLRYRVGASSRLEGFLADWVPARIRDLIVAAMFR